MGEINYMLYKCSFCGKLQKSYLSKGYCTSCYLYFEVNNFNIFEKSKYGSLSYVTDKNSNQYGMPICHICGKAYTKLQQHVWYSHNLTRLEYCDLFGLDHRVKLTEITYSNKMRNHALDNNMDIQLINAGANTRFKSNHKSYVRSYQTVQRLKNQFKV